MTIELTAYERAILLSLLNTVEPPSSPGARKALERIYGKLA